MKIKLERIEPSQIIKPIKAAPHTPPYKIHKYFARRPWNVFSQMISAVSEKDELILDPFCGGGVTVYEGCKLNRKVIGIDINPLAIFIVRNMVKSSKNKGDLVSAISECHNYLQELYSIQNAFQFDNEEYDLMWSELTYKVRCNKCDTENLLLNDNKISNGVYKCRNEKCVTNDPRSKLGFYTKDTKRIGYEYIFLVSKKGKNKIVKSYNKKEIKLLNKHIEYLRNELEAKNLKIEKSEIPVLWDRQYEDQLNQKGIKYFEDFFTERNLLINLLLRAKIDEYKQSLSGHNYELLRLIHSNILKETNIMSFTNDAWQSGNPTTWSKHAYWIPSQFCEVNILSAFDKAVDRILKSLEFNDKSFPPELNVTSEFNNSSPNEITLINGTIKTANLPSESVDAIITDPPYGSNVQYLELSHFWYYWNKDLYQVIPNFEEEAVANRKKFNGAKSMKDYEDLLYSVFKESFSALKTDRHLTLTFNNKNVTAWLSLLISIFKSGFIFETNGIIFQDGVENYKQTAHTKYSGSPFGDFIYLFKKGVKKTQGYKFEGEEDFIEKLDQIFKNYISKNGSQDKNFLKRRMFLEAIPLIEEYSKNELIKNPNHNLYNYFTKNYFNKLYN